MSQTYSTGDLYDLADRPSDDVRVSAAGDQVGVALPDWSSIQPCAILSPDTARKLGAQLLLAADELDAIDESLRRDLGGFGLTRENTGVTPNLVTNRTVVNRADILGRALNSFLIKPEKIDEEAVTAMRRYIAELVELAGGAQL